MLIILTKEITYCKVYALYNNKRDETGAIVDDSYIASGTLRELMQQLGVCKTTLLRLKQGKTKSTDLELILLEGVQGIPPKREKRK